MTPATLRVPLVLDICVSFVGWSVSQPGLLRTGVIWQFWLNGDTVIMWHQLPSCQ